MSMIEMRTPSQHQVRTAQSMLRNALAELDATAVTYSDVMDDYEQDRHQLMARDTLAVIASIIRHLPRTVDQFGRPAIQTDILDAMLSNKSLDGYLPRRTKLREVR